MVKTALLTLGRMPKGLTVARALKTAGWRVVVADPLGWHLSRSSRAVDRSVKVTAPRTDAAAYRKDVLRIVAEEAVALIVPIADEIVHAAGVVPDLPAGTALFGLPQAQLITLYDKAQFMGLAHTHGMRVPSSAPLGDTAADHLAEASDTVVKRVNGCSGVGLTWVGRGQSLPHPSGDPMLVQTRIRGREVSSFSITHQGRVLVTVVYEATVTSGTVSVAFQRVTGPVAQTVAEDVARFVASTSLTGFVSFDFIVDSAGAAWAIECNPRVTSGVHFVDPSDLAQAITAPDRVETVRLTGRDRYQQIFPTWLEAYAALFQKGRSAGPIFRELLTARDVTWDRRDPWPLLLMTVTSHEILGRAIRSGISLGEAATADILWQAGDQPAKDPIAPEAPGCG